MTPKQEKETNIVWLLDDAETLQFASLNKQEMTPIFTIKVTAKDPAVQQQKQIH